MELRVGRMWAPSLSSPSRPHRRHEDPWTGGWPVCRFRRQAVSSLWFPRGPGLPGAGGTALRVWKCSKPSQRRWPRWEAELSADLRAKCRRGSWTHCRRGRAGRRGGAQTQTGLPAVFPAIHQPGPALRTLLAPHLDMR